MIQQVLRLTWYRFRATFANRRGGYLAVILLVGLVGGLAMGALAGARRTQSAFPAFLTRTASSDLEVQTFSISNGPAGQGIAPSLGNEIAHLPHVKQVAASGSLFLGPTDPSGAFRVPAAIQTNEVSLIGSINGRYFSQDQVTVAQGRLADPQRADEFVATGEAARLLGWRVGETIPMGAFTLQQASLPAFGTTRVQPVLRIAAKLVGTVVFSNQVARDDVDRFPTYALFTPALTRRLPVGSVFFPSYGLRLGRGSRDVAAVEREILHVLPPGSYYQFHVTSVVDAQVERASKPESIALGVFGMIAALATLLIAGQAIGRQLRTNGDDLEVMRALGADSVMRSADGLVGILATVVVGSLIAAGVAVALSPLSPLGPVRQVDPSPGFAFDWTVLAYGVLVLVVGLSALAVALAYRGTRQRQGRDRSALVARTSSSARAMAEMGLPAPAVAGVRFALERGRGRTAVPVRSALLGSALAVAVVVATLTFGSGLSTLVSHPTLYGWNWSYAIEQVGGGNIPPGPRTFSNIIASWPGGRGSRSPMPRSTARLSPSCLAMRAPT
jgi:hypothetical protein